MTMPSAACLEESLFEFLPAVSVGRTSGTKRAVFEEGVRVPKNLGGSRGRFALPPCVALAVAPLRLASIGRECFEMRHFSPAVRNLAVQVDSFRRWVFAIPSWGSMNAAECPSKMVSPTSRLSLRNYARPASARRTFSILSAFLNDDGLILS